MNAKKVKITRQAIVMNDEKTNDANDKSPNNQQPLDKYLLTAMDIYKYLWKGRDFELDHLWQRSVF